MTEANQEQTTEPVESNSVAGEALDSTKEQAPTSVEQEQQEISTDDNSFIESLAEDLREQSNIKDFKDVNQLAKSYIELQKMVGKSIRIPSEDASDEAKQEFYNKLKDVDGILVKNDEKLFDKLGRPEEASNYKFEIKEELQEVFNKVPEYGQEIDDFKTIAHEIGLSNEQAAKLVEFRMDAMESQLSKEQAARTQAENALKQMWGEDYDNRMDSAKKVMAIFEKKYPNEVQSLVYGPAGNNPVFLNMVSELSQLYAEKNHEGMSGAQFGETPESAKLKIQEFKADKGKMEAYLNQFHPLHDKVVKERYELEKLANPSVR